MNSNSRIISTDEDPSLRIESSAIINLRGVSTKINKYNSTFLKGKRKHVRLLNDYKFGYLRNALDAVIKENASAGVGLTRKQGEVIASREEQLWEKGVLGDSRAASTTLGERGSR